MKKTMNLLLIALMLFLPVSTAVADNTKWMLVTNDGATCEMDSVGSFVMTDDEETFDVLNVSGGILAAKVKRVTFELKTDYTAVKSLETQGAVSLLSHAVSNQLVIVGAQHDAIVYSSAGAVVAKGMPKDETIVINVCGLPQGVYLVRSGKQTFKFIKK